MERSNAQPRADGGLNIAIIGGAGVRTPLLVRGLVRSGLPLRAMRVYDPDRDRLAVMAPLIERVSGASIDPRDTVADCVKGADFVIASIRPGGIERRARYEQIALEHGVIGQETVGVGGWAMALATIPAMVSHANEVARHAPDAWMISFTNPVGMVTEGVLKGAQAPIIGICDTPTELFEEIAHALGVASVDCHFDYLGLNHLGWVREVWLHGEPQMAKILADDGLLTKIYRIPLFDHARLREIGALPTEYVYFYERTAQALANTREGGTTRGAALASMNRAFFDSLRKGVDDPVRLYESYLAERSGTYFSLEARGDSRVVQTPSEASLLSGYDKIAVSVIDAIHRNSDSIVPLSVSNRGNISSLRPDDVVEVPCLINSSGAHPLHVGAPPQSVAGLLSDVKAYERATVAAALSGSREEAIAALALNPLVRDEAKARQLADALL